MRLTSSLAAVRASNSVAAVPLPTVSPSTITRQRKPPDWSALTRTVVAIAFSLSLLLLDRLMRVPNTRKRAKPKPKYQSKKTRGLKWTGRGMLPSWMREEMKGTKLTKDSFLIK
jgi:hypothetical protein